jgi:hypothetical protein
MPGSRVSSKRRAAQTATTYSGINAIFWAEAAADFRRDDAEFGFRRLRKLNRAAISESYQGLGMI